MSNGVGVGRRDDLEDEQCSLVREPSPAALLPLVDELARAFVVHDRRACGGKRQSPPRALGAATDGPRPGCAAPLAERPPEPDERSSALLTERDSGRCTDGAALRQEQLEHTAIVGGYSLRLCEKMRSASRSVSAEPMSYHAPGNRHVKTAVRG